MHVLYTCTAIWLYMLIYDVIELMERFIVFKILDHILYINIVANCILAEGINNSQTRYYSVMKFINLKAQNCSAQTK